MANHAGERRLAAILAADVVGYSRLMGADEAGTLGAVQLLRSEVIEPRIAEHKGRLFKAMGDGFLAEFPSVVNAVACAAAIQTVLAEKNANQSDDLLLQLRIGVHLGDVIAEGGDLFGDGVNVAARVEGLAPPGGVAISAMVYDNIGGRIDLIFEDMGEHHLKNIAKPMRIYRLTGTSRSGVQARQIESSKPSIAVLPFTNMSGDPEQDFFTDGLTEDIITDISNVPGFIVIARNSTFVYKGRPTDVRQIARDLGVKYVLEGSARRVAQRLRVNVQLIDAADGGKHVFAERFDRDAIEVFTVQDEITRRVVETITGRLLYRSDIGRKHPSNLEAYELCLKCRSLAFKSLSAHLEGRALLERAIVLAPDYCEAHWRMADFLLASWVLWSEPQEPSRQNALIYAERAVSLDPQDGGAHSMLGAVLSYERRWDEAEHHLKKAIAINPNDTETLVRLSDFSFLSGKPEVAVEFAMKALRLNPYPPGYYYWFLGQAQIAAGKYEEAIATLKKEETYRSTSRRDLSVALLKTGRTIEAREEAKLFMLDNPNWRISTTFEGEAVFRNPADRQFWIDAYRLAGLPE